MKLDTIALLISLIILAGLAIFISEERNQYKRALIELKCARYVTNPMTGYTQFIIDKPSK